MTRKIISHHNLLRYLRSMNFNHVHHDKNWDKTGMNEAEILEKIAEFLEKDIQPYINGHGGSLRLLSLENGILTVAFSGACASCSALPITLRAVVDRSVRKNFREVEKVVLFNNHS